MLSTSENVPAQIEVNRIALRSDHVTRLTILASVGRDHGKTSFNPDGMYQTIGL